MREVIGLAMQEQKTSLRRNRHTDLICDFQAIATFEALLSEKYLNVTEQLGLIAGRESRKEPNVAPDCVQPFLWIRSRDFVVRDRE